MRISDWSSDVCSSDLLEPRAADGLGIFLVDLGGHAGRVRSDRGDGAEAEADRPVGDLLQPLRADRQRVDDRVEARLLNLTALFRRERGPPWRRRSAEHTSELQSLMRISYAVFCSQ